MSYPTISMIVPVIDGLQHLPNNTAGGLDVLCGILSRLVEEKFGDLFDDDQLCVATVVDPRFKLGPFDSEDRRHRAVEATLKLMVATTSSEATATTTTSDADPPAVTPQPTSLSLW